MNLFAIIWLALMVLFLVVEGATVVMASLWFAFGALAAMVASILGAAVWLQIVVFFIVSAALLACLRPMVKKHFTPKLSATNVDAVIGARGYVTSDIDNVSATGSVKLGAMEWTARSATGEPIPTGSMVRVEHIEGVKVFVIPVTVEAHSL